MPYFFQILCKTCKNNRFLSKKQRIIIDYKWIFIAKIIDYTLYWIILAKIIDFIEMDYDGFFFFEKKNDFSDHKTDYVV